jgi:hypothetical protein
MNHKSALLDYNSRLSIDAYKKHEKVIVVS